MFFWKQFPQGPCVPNCSCEFMQQSAFILQPYAFWSSLAYVLGSIFLYLQIKNRTFDFKLWTALNILLAFASLFTHASFTKLALAMDFAGIVAVISFFSMMSLTVKLKRSNFSSSLIFFGYYLFLCLAFYSMSKWARIGLCVVIFWLSVGDMVRTMGWGFLKARMFIYSVLVIWISFGFFLLDELRVLCDPHGPIQGHTVWHFGTAFGIYLYGKWRFQTARLG